jgi:mRNA interferase RelE/StbE
MYNLELAKKVVKFIDSLNAKERIRIAKTLESLCENPFRQDIDIKKLAGKEEIYRLRIGDLRFLYKIYSDRLTILMFKAGHRKDIYR